MIASTEFLNLLPKLKPSAATVYLILLAYKNNSTHTCYPSIAKIARDTGLGRHTVERALKDLEGSGLITRTKRKDKDNPKRNATNLYTLHAVHQKGVAPKMPTGSPKTGVVTKPNELINTTIQKSSTSKAQPITAAVPKARPSASSKSNLKPWEKDKKDRAAAEEATHNGFYAISAANQKRAEDHQREQDTIDPNTPTPGRDAFMARYNRTNKQKAKTSC